MIALLPAFLTERLIVSQAGCWEWQGARSHRGYGHVSIQSERRGPLMVHRVVWEHLRGVIPAGLELDHLCRNTSCANPDHLEPVTHRENVLRGVAARPRGETCVNGHALTDENVYWKPRPRGTLTRECRKCRSDQRRRYNARRAA